MSEVKPTKTPQVSDKPDTSTVKRGRPTPGNKSSGLTVNLPSRNRTDETKTTEKSIDIQPAVRQTDTSSNDLPPDDDEAESQITTPEESLTENSADQLSFHHDNDLVEEVSNTPDTQLNPSELTSRFRKREPRPRGSASLHPDQSTVGNEIIRDETPTVTAKVELDENGNPLPRR